MSHNTQSTGHTEKATLNRNEMT